LLLRSHVDAIGKLLRARTTGAFAPRSRAFARGIARTDVAAAMAARDMTCKEGNGGTCRACCARRLWKYLLQDPPSRVTMKTPENAFRSGQAAIKPPARDVGSADRDRQQQSS
jgi:hypothetical protein